MRFRSLAAVGIVLGVSLRLRLSFGVIVLLKLYAAFGDSGAWSSHPLWALLHETDAACWSHRYALFNPRAAVATPTLGFFS